MQPRTAGSPLRCTITGSRTVKGPQPVLRTKGRARKSCSERLASCSSPGCPPLWEGPQGQKGPVLLRPRDPGPLYLPATCGPSHAFQINTESAPSLSVARPPEARAMWLSVHQTGAGLSGAGACFQPEAAVAGHTGADRAPGPPGAQAVGESLLGQSGWGGGHLEAMGPPLCPQGSPAPQGAWGWSVLREPQPAERPCFWVSIQAGAGTQTPGVESGGGLGWEEALHLSRGDWDPELEMTQRLLQDRNNREGRNEKKAGYDRGARACTSPGGSVPATPPGSPPKAGAQYPPARAPEGSWPTPGSLPTGLGGRWQEGR